MSRTSTVFAPFVLSVLACNIFAQEQTVAPEITPPLLPAPPSITAPEYIPPTSPTPRSSVPLWSRETDTAPHFVFPSTTFESPAYRVEPVALYGRVRVRDEHKAHPHGIPTVIAVADPRDGSCLVHVEICMPPCACERITHNRRGNRVTYDFGKYEIEIISRLGVVIVDYDT